MNEYLIAVTLDYVDNRKSKTTVHELAKGVDAESARLDVHQKYKLKARDEGIEDITAVVIGPA